MATKTPIAGIFESLKGSWRLRRSLQSALPGFPSGIFEGVATFSPRAPTAHSAAGELLYTERGQLKTDTGLTLTANRKYVYRYSADEDKISAWFVKPDDAKRSVDSDGSNDDGEVDYLFHDLEMSAGADRWTGRGEHLCSLDMYWSYYEFRYPGEGGNGMNVFGVKFKVLGPQKDYTSDTAYVRVDASDDAAAASAS